MILFCIFSLFQVPYIVSEPGLKGQVWYDEWRRIMGEVVNAESPPTRSLQKSTKVYTDIRYENSISSGFISQVPSGSKTSRLYNGG